MLPLHSTAPPAPATSSVREYLRRLLRPSQMDIEYTSWQMLHLCFSPAKVYRTTAWHKQTKNQWARDDPGFVAIQAALLLVSSLAWGVAFGSHGIGSAPTMLWLVLWSLLIDFLAFGFAVASVTRWIANRFLAARGDVHSVEQTVEWLYAFDVHCNSFFPVFLLVHVVQYFLLPLLTQPTFFATLLANTLYAGAWSYYMYITFLGYHVLPFLRNTVIFLYPVCRQWSRLIPAVPFSLLPDAELEAAYMHQEQLPPPGDFMQWQSDITPPMRCMLVDWLADLSAEFQLPDWTLHLAAQILDRYLERVDVPKETLQLVGAAALLLAKKVTHVEGEPPGAACLVALSAQAFTLPQILRLEIDVLATLEFHVWLPTSSVFLGLFCEQLAVLASERVLRRDCPALEQVALYANYIAEQGIQHHAVQQFAPSCVASACIALSLENLGVPYWNSGLVRLITRLHGAGDKVVADCMAELVTACTSQTSLEATKRRFQQLSPALLMLPVSAAHAKKPADTGDDITAVRFLTQRFASPEVESAFVSHHATVQSSHLNIARFCVPELLLLAVLVGFALCESKLVQEPCRGGYFVYFGVAAFMLFALFLCVSSWLGGIVRYSQELLVLCCSLLLAACSATEVARCPTRPYRMEENPVTFYASFANWGLIGIFAFKGACPWPRSLLISAALYLGVLAPNVYLVSASLHYIHWAVCLGLGTAFALFSVGLWSWRHRKNFAISLLLERERRQMFLEKSATNALIACIFPKTVAEEIISSRSSPDYDPFKGERLRQLSRLFVMAENIAASFGAEKQEFCFELHKRGTRVQGVGQIVYYQMFPSMQQEAAWTMSEFASWDAAPAPTIPLRVKEVTIHDVAIGDIPLYREKTSILTLMFPSPKKERAFMDQYVAKYLQQTRWLSLSASAILLVGGSFTLLFESFQWQDKLPEYVLVVSVFSIFVWTWIRPLRERAWAFHLAVFCSAIVATAAMMYLINMTIWYPSTLNGFLAWELALNSMRLPFYYAAPLTLIQFPAMVPVVAVKGYEYVTLELLQKRKQEYHHEKVIGEELVDSTVPRRVLHKVVRWNTQSNELFLAESVSSATIMVCSVAGFEGLDQKLDAISIVKIVDSLIIKLDAMTFESGLSPLQSGAGEYVVVSNVHNDCVDHVRTAVDLAVRITQAMGEWNSVQNPTHHDVHMQIALHTDRLLTGVIRLKCMQFDCWGSGMTIAGALSKCAPIGFVLLSEETVQQGHLTAQRFKGMVVEGRTIETYLYRGPVTATLDESPVAFEPTMLDLNYVPVNGVDYGVVGSSSDLQDYFPAAACDPDGVVQPQVGSVSSGVVESHATNTSSEGPPSCSLAVSSFQQINSVDNQCCASHRMPH
eukprot:m51a1_g7670 hypothetical protein (1365) ;mRNA; r:465705-482863